MNTNHADLIRFSEQVFIRRSSVIAITPQVAKDGTPLLSACTVAIEQIGLLNLSLSPSQAAAKLRGEEEAAPSPLRMDRH